jgi:hypothetical protein
MTAAVKEVYNNDTEMVIYREETYGMIRYKMA